MKLDISHQIAYLENTRTLQILQGKLKTDYPRNLINLMMIYET